MLLARCKLRLYDDGHRIACALSRAAVREFFWTFSDAVGFRFASLGRDSAYRFRDRWIPVPLPPPVNSFYLINFERNRSYPHRERPGRIGLGLGPGMTASGDAHPCCRCRLPFTSSPHCMHMPVHKIAGSANCAEELPQSYRPPTPLTRGRSGGI